MLRSVNGELYYVPEGQVGPGDTDPQLMGTFARPREACEAEQREILLESLRKDRALLDLYKLMAGAQRVLNYELLFKED